MSSATNDKPLFELWKRHDLVTIDQQSNILGDRRLFYRYVGLYLFHCERTAGRRPQGLIRLYFLIEAALLVWLVTTPVTLIYDLSSLGERLIPIVQATAYVSTSTKVTDDYGNTINYRVSYALTYQDQRCQNTETFREPYREGAPVPVYFRFDGSTCVDLSTSSVFLASSAAEVPGFVAWSIFFAVMIPVCLVLLIAGFWRKIGTGVAAFFSVRFGFWFSFVITLLVCLPFVIGAVGVGVTVGALPFILPATILLVFLRVVVLARPQPGRLVEGQITGTRTKINTDSYDSPVNEFYATVEFPGANPGEAQQRERRCVDGTKEGAKVLVYARDLAKEYTVL